MWTWERGERTQMKLLRNLRISTQLAARFYLVNTQVQGNDLFNVHKDCMLWVMVKNQICLWCKIRRYHQKQKFILSAFVRGPLRVCEWIWEEGMDVVCKCCFFPNPTD